MLFQTDGFRKRFPTGTRGLPGVSSYCYSSQATSISGRVSSVLTINLFWIHTPATRHHQPFPVVRAPHIIRCRHTRKDEKINFPLYQCILYILYTHRVLVTFSKIFFRITLTANGGYLRAPDRWPDEYIIIVIYRYYVCSIVFRRFSVNVFWPHGGSRATHVQIVVSFSPSDGTLL